jgi:TolA-binding protein|uniref:Uncharacterized protein n=1 Tax=Fagus sylvatica TaxID=28930 RepID=A0A2N9J1J2_FAGSY
MCQYQAWEDGSPLSEDFTQRTGNGIEHVAERQETQMAMLEARIARVEARVKKLELVMQKLQRQMRVVYVLFLVTVAYAIWK